MEVDGNKRRHANEHSGISPLLARRDVQVPQLRQVGKVGGVNVLAVVDRQRYGSPTLPETSCIAAGCQYESNRLIATI